MLNNVHIITDSCALFVDSGFVDAHAITVVPNKIEISGKVYQEGVDLTPEQVMPLIAGLVTPPTVTSPSVADFVTAYNAAARTSDAILSIHASREMYSSWHNARRAAQQLSGHCEIAVIDSQSLCIGQGLLVQIAAGALQSADSFETLVRAVRGAVERIYSIYYVETINYLLHNKIMPPAHSVLATMLNVKPLLTIENGRLTPIEKVRTRLQAVERMVEYVTEFDNIIEAVIVQHKIGISDQTRMLQERLAIEFPQQTFAHTLYSPSLAALIGADASGLAILEDPIQTGGADDDED